MIYFDTSLLVAALASEAATPRAQEAINEATTIAVSEWSLTEFAAAFSIKLRMRTVSETDRATARRRLQRYIAQNFELLPVNGSHFRQATAFADDHQSNLRAGDALHLAIAAEIGATVWTLDQRMAAAGPLVGVATRLV